MDCQITHFKQSCLLYHHYLLLLITNNINALNAELKKFGSLQSKLSSIKTKLLGVHLLDSLKHSSNK